MIIEIDPKSGFCFGVVRAISEAERALSAGDGVRVFSLGDIVHNRVEVQRLADLGLQPISRGDLEGGVDVGIGVGPQRLLIRAHGEPPSTYALAADLGIDIIDATCPVVAKLQQRVVRAYEQMEGVGGQVVLLGKRGHAEVVGLTGQVGDRVIVVEGLGDLDCGAIDFSRPIYLLSQTTQSIALFDALARALEGRMVGGAALEVCDTICRQVSSREDHLRAFVSRFDVVLFVCGKKSSNGKVLFELCCSAKSDGRCYNIESEEELCGEWFEGASSVGICGATSTPSWLMERVAEALQAR